MRLFQSFRWKEANFRIYSPRADLVIEEIQKQRGLLESYIQRCPDFLSALSPIALLPDASEIIVRMHEASLATGVGPMAAVAGAIAQFAAEAALHGDNQLAYPEAIVENGGDIYLSAKEDVVIALYAGNSSLSGKLAFLIKPDQMPLSICSSSSKMGHSLSFGNCDLATVVAKDGALADAAATLTCNRVKEPGDVNPALEEALAIPGILGVLVVKDDQIGLAGDLPDLVKHTDIRVKDKITHAAGVVV
jgi:uncharacterized protein